ncbi:MAG: sigma-54-dependent Fis family transcriptional regulator [Peptococcaceae bacterium]
MGFNQVWVQETETIQALIKAESNKNKPYILNGWKRCISLGVNPYQGKCPMVLKGEKLNELLRENQELISFAKPFMEDLYSFVKGSGFVVVLADKKARVLEVLGDAEILSDSAQQLNFIKGALWDEQYVGNTAINTSLTEDKPVQVCLLHREWACSAAPIKSNGESIGVLNVSGYQNMVYPHTLGMVMAAARTIETKMAAEMAARELQLKNKYQNAIVESMSDGLLTIDSKGYVTYLNQIGADILNVESGVSIGRHVSQLVDFKPIVLEVLNTGQGYIDKEFIITNNHGIKMRFIKTAVLIRDENGNITGVVDTFRKINRVQKMVNEIVGAQANFSFENIIGSSAIFNESIRLAKIAAKSSSNVLIQGESGTGKELFAQAIHKTSGRKEQPFVTINCAAIPRELIESELFGYEGGAFTGALKNGRPGKFELANGGTIFLDEIGDMPLDMQVKLLRVLQEKKITRIGGTSIFDIDVRIIAATNKNLLEECAQDNFRRDLFYRLNVLNINIPPLRERVSDIKELAMYLIHKINKKLDKNVEKISERALKYLINYNWPGNVRELENVIERAINISRTRQINAGDLPLSILREREEQKADFVSPEIVKIESIEDLEKKAIKKALEIMGGNISQAAGVLKVSRNTLYNKIKKYALDV